MDRIFQIAVDGPGGAGKSTVAKAVAKELNISVDAAIFPEMVNQTVSKTVVDFFAGKSEAEIEKFIALCKQAEAFQKDE